MNGDNSNFKLLAANCRLQKRQAAIKPKPTRRINNIYTLGEILPVVIRKIARRK